MIKRRRRLRRDVVASLGRALYDRHIRRRVASERKGRIVAIDVDSGSYEVGDDVLGTAERLFARHPQAQIWFVRIGHRALHRIGSWREADNVA